MKTTIRGKIAVVTGGTRGIGLAIAERLLREGAKVAICGTSGKTVDAAIDRLKSFGEVFGAVADVSKADQVRNFIASVQRKFGRIDILVNNAGVGIFKPVADLSHAEWEQMIGLNLSGVYYCSKEVLPIFKQQGGGYVINIGSLAGKNPFAGGAGYNASKFGLNGFSEAMMLDHRYDGLRVSTIMPVSVATEFGGVGGEAAEWKIAPEDIAEVVVALVQMPLRTTVSAVEVRPSKPPRKA